MPPRKKAAKARATTTSTSKKAAATKKTTTGKKATKRARSPESSSDSEVEQGKPPQKRAKNAAEDTAPEPEVPTERGPSGKFDLYAMELPFLAKVYLPPGQKTSEPRFGALYDKILEYQAKPDSTARCVIPDAAKLADDPEKRGRLESAVLEDPMEGAPWDIALVDLRVVDSVVFPPTERAQFATPPQPNCGAGIEALMDGHCGVRAAGGVFRMQRAWSEERGGQTVEVWEGYLSFDVRYSAMYKRKGHGDGEKIGFPFWAVRARKGQDGKEIGLDEAD
ncbi:hypothetical protein B0H19DRAFT_1110808 [Mycena capillaripes]|nr:hypothetical protein B0H19DRAFT_1110808 [Mycena capillaripes]